MEKTGFIKEREPQLRIRQQNTNVQCKGNMEIRIEISSEENERSQSFKRRARFRNQSFKRGFSNL
jgi:hypothetical protein